MARRVSASRVKANWIYTVEEASEAVGVTEQTIRSWLKRGLHALASKRPTLILGCALKDYINRTRQKRSQKLRIGEFRCFRCKSAHPPAFRMATFKAMSPTHGRLEAFCGCCEGPVSRIVSASSLPAWTAFCEIDGNTGGTP